MWRTLKMCACVNVACVGVKLIPLRICNSVVSFPLGLPLSPPSWSYWQWWNCVESGPKPNEISSYLVPRVAYLYKEQLHFIPNVQCRTMPFLVQGVGWTNLLADRLNHIPKAKATESRFHKQTVSQCSQWSSIFRMRLFDSKMGTNTPTGQKHEFIWMRRTRLYFSTATGVSALRDGETLQHRGIRTRRWGHTSAPASR